MLNTTQLPTAEEWAETSEDERAAWRDEWNEQVEAEEAMYARAGGES